MCNSFDMSIQAEEIYTEPIVDLEELNDENTPSSPQRMLLFEKTLEGLRDFIWSSEGKLTDGSGRVISTKEIESLYDESADEPEMKNFLIMAGLDGKRDFIFYVKGFANAMLRN